MVSLARFCSKRSFLEKGDLKVDDAIFFLLALRIGRVKLRILLGQKSLHFMLIRLLLIGNSILARAVDHDKLGG